MNTELYVQGYAAGYHQYSLFQCTGYLLLKSRTDDYEGDTQYDAYAEVDEEYMARRDWWGNLPPSDRWDWLRGYTAAYWDIPPRERIFAP